MSDERRRIRPRTHAWCGIGVVLALPLLLAPLLANGLGWPIQSVVTRMLLLGGVLWLVWLVGLPDRRTVVAVLGPRPWRPLAVGIGVTVVVCVVYSFCLVQGGAESLRPELNRPRRLLTGLLTGLLVAALEEPVFRRLLLRGLSFGGARVIGVLGSSLLYAVAHYLRPEKTAVRADHGLADSWAVYVEVGRNFLGPLSDPAPGIGVFLLGVVLAVVTLRFGLVHAIAIHAGLVWYSKSDGVFLQWKDDLRDPFYGSSEFLYDGPLFWIVCVVGLLVASVLPARRSATETRSH